MNDEIKEILDKLKDKNNYISHSMILLSIKERTAILDYITNLQQIEQEHQRINGELREENKKLQDKYEKMKENAEMLSKGYSDLEKRNEKAIEYIKHFENQDWYVEGCQIKDLKSILQGDDKE